MPDRILCRLRVARRVAVLAVLLHATVVAADAPWEAGVSPRVRAEVQALFEKGNQLFAQQAHAPALEQYEAAIALWDHPLIRLNMAITELRLDRVLDAAENLDAALRYGAAPFDEQDYRNALAQQQVIARRVGRIEASCNEPGGEVLLDGEPWLRCPGRGSRRVLAGQHALLGQKDGYLPVARRLTIAAGENAVEVLTFVPLGAAASSEAASNARPLWRSPWVWAGAATLAAGAGVRLHVLANRDQDRLDRLIADSSMYDFATAEAVLERGKTRVLWARTLYAGAGALAAVAVTFAVWPRFRGSANPTTPDRAVEVRITPGGLAVSRTF